MSTQKGAIAAINKTQVFVETLITRRILKFCPELKIPDVFRANFTEIIYRITRETLGVSRTIGIILQNAFIQASSNSDGKIGLSEINYGIMKCQSLSIQKADEWLEQPKLDYILIQGFNNT